MKKESEISKECVFFVHNIKWLRKHNGLSKKKMAECLGIGIWSLNKIEKGEIPPRLSANILCAVYSQFGILPSILTSCLLERRNKSLPE